MLHRSVLALSARPASLVRALTSATNPSPPAAAFATDAERIVYTKLQEAFQPRRLAVADISGGCGAMYQIEIASSAFNGISKVQQTRLVNRALKDEMKSWHGVRLTTLPVAADE
ncbi:bola protein [Blastocladiella britannica]|nr:bola protein [Blastocladiella britannica]